MLEIEFSHDKANGIEKDLISILGKTLAELVKEIIYFRSNFEKEEYHHNVGLDSLAGIGHGVRTNLDNLKYKIEVLINAMLEEELDIMGNHLSEVYLGIHNNKENLDVALNNQWIGANFKETLIENHRHFIFTLSRDIVASLIRGDGVRQLKDIIKKAINTFTKRVIAVMRTETTYITNKAILDKALSEGKTRYRYIARLDDRTCGTCKMLNGEIGFIKDAVPGKNIPPAHTNCRCTIEII